MGKRSLASKIGLFAALLLVADINFKPYEKNFVLSQDVSEYVIEKISTTSRSTITFDIKDGWIEKRLVSLLSSKKGIKYNLLLKGELEEIRIQNIRQILPMKVGYIVDKFITPKRISELERLRPSFISLIFKRVPEPFETAILSKGKIKDITIMLDRLSAVEFVKRISDFSGMRLVLKPLDIEALEYLCGIKSDILVNAILIDSRILDPKEIDKHIQAGCGTRRIYEISSSTFYNNFLLFIKSDISSLNIYMSSPIFRDGIIDWIRKTDP